MNLTVPRRKWRFILKFLLISYLIFRDLHMNLSFTLWRISLFSKVELLSWIGWKISIIPLNVCLNKDRKISFPLPISILMNLSFIYFLLIFGLLDLIKTILIEKYFFSCAMFNEIFDITCSSFATSMKNLLPSNFDSLFEQSKHFISLESCKFVTSSLYLKKLLFKNHVIALIVANTLL